MKMDQRWRSRPPVTSRGPFEAAVDRHRQGFLADAERLYELQLKSAPGHFGALHNLGLLRTQQGRFEEATALIRKALRKNGKSPEAHNTLGNILHAARQYGEADVAFGRALALQPDYPEALNNRGVTLQALNRGDEAVKFYERAIKLRPGYAEAHHNLGSVLRTLGRYDHAVAHFESALANSRASASTHRNLADTLQNLHRYGEAIDHYLEALALAEGDAELYYNLATALVTLNRYQEALANYQRALALEPNYPEARNNLGAALLALDRSEEALPHFHKALIIAPNNAEAHHNLGRALLMLKRTMEAVGSFEEALRIRPDYTAAHINLGSALQELGQHDKAVEQFQAALRLDSAGGARGAEAQRADAAAIHFSNGRVFAELGRIDAARLSFEKAVDLEPGRAFYYAALSEIKRFAADDPYLAKMEALAANIASLSPDQQMHLHFGLGKALADVGELERSFHHQLQANALKRQTFEYDEAGHLTELDRIRAAFTSDAFRALRGVGYPSALPVFVLGMPRSGTSLVEQILASHPLVFGAGELDHFARLVTAATNLDDKSAATTRDQVRRLGLHYLACIKALAPQSDRITDKMPGNFRFIGLIHLALPNARIIHTRRNPVDTCLSCFSKFFTGDQPFAYDLGELGRYYRAYRRLMEHWRSVLPQGTMLEIDYEDVVANVEEQARRIVEYCGLEWDEACLEFHKTERAVRTASVTQVRQPIYQSSVGRWKPYAHMLGPLFEALEFDPR